MREFSLVALLLVCLCGWTVNSFINTGISSRSSRSVLYSSSEPRKWEIKNKDSSPQGGGAGGGGGEKDWKSGYVFNKHTQKKRRNDPWWMREEESNNPRILPAYKPWWVTDNVVVDDTWKVADLRAEAIKRGLDSKGKKEELLKLIIHSSSLHDLKDSGFRVPVYIECKPSDRPSCYPEIYEGAESATALRNKAMNTLKAPTA